MEYFQVLESELKKSVDGISFWKNLLEIARVQRDPSKIAFLDKQDLGRVSKTIEKKIKEGMGKNPIPATATSIYFGLFDKENSNFDPVQGFYICASDKIKDSDGDFLCDPVWKPTWGYFKCRLLDSIVQIGQGMDLEPKFPVKGDNVVQYFQDGKLLRVIEDGKTIEIEGEEKNYWMNRMIETNEDDDLFTYFLSFGASIAIVKRLKETGIFGKHEVYVGFDSGDYLEVV